MKKMFLFLFLTLGALSLFCLSSCANKYDHGPKVVKGHGKKAHWSYSGEAGPDYWGDLCPKFAACKSGVNQSPINISDSVSAKLNPVKFRYRSNASEIVNNGHTIKVNYQTQSVIAIDDKKFELKQFHFYSPSENNINDQSFPMEAHFVHADTNGNLAVVGVMYVKGSANPALEALWKQMPKQKGDKHRLNSEVNAMELMPKNKSYYRFTGSLTTPPCSEGVHWIVLKNPVTMSKDQLIKFKRVMPRNNRPIQPINSRVILSAP